MEINFSNLQCLIDSYVNFLGQLISGLKFWNLVVLLLILITLASFAVNNCVCQAHQICNIIHLWQLVGCWEVCSLVYLIDRWALLIIYSSQCYFYWVWYPKFWTTTSLLVLVMTASLMFEDHGFCNMRNCTPLFHFRAYAEENQVTGDWF